MPRESITYCEGWSLRLTPDSLDSRQKGTRIRPSALKSGLGLFTVNTVLFIFGGFCNGCITIRRLYNSTIVSNNVLVSQLFYDRR